MEIDKTGKEYMHEWVVSTNLDENEASLVINISR